MKTRLFTTTLPDLCAPGKLPTATESAASNERQWGAHFKTKEALLGWYLTTDHGAKAPALAFLEQHLRSQHEFVVLSLGAGPCVLEYLLKQRMPALSVVAADYNPFFIKNAQRLFPEITAVEYDFFKDSPAALAKKIGKDIDTAVYFGSSYVMDDDVFVDQLAGLKEIGVREIIDFQAGFLPWSKVPRTLLSELRWGVLARLGRASSRGVFHGYCRTRDELRRLYKRAGLTVVQELRIGTYDYVSVCRTD